MNDKNVRTCNLGMEKKSRNETIKLVEILIKKAINKQMVWPREFLQ